MQKKNKTIPRSALLVRIVIIVMTSNILLLGLINFFTPTSHNLSCTDQLESTSLIYFKLPAVLKTRFEAGKKVILIEPATSIQVKATLWEQHLDEFSQELSTNSEHTSTIPRNMYIVSTSEEDLAKLYSMKNVEILPSSLQGKQLNKKVKNKNNKGKIYEISY